MSATVNAGPGDRVSRWSLGTEARTPEEVFWIAATAVILLIAALLPLLWEPRYFFHGDTQIAYTGWWYELGTQVRAGHLPLLDPLRWEAGNYVAEGQWGLFSPLTIFIGLACTVAPNLVVFASVLKVCLVIVGGLGAYAVVRSYDVPPAAAFVAGVLVGLSGQAVYLDWPSWVNGQMAVALLPWAWWGIRRAARPGASPLPALVVCYLIATIGYVYALLYLCLVLGDTACSDASSLGTPALPPRCSVSAYSVDWLASRSTYRAYSLHR